MPARKKQAVTDACRLYDVFQPAIIGEQACPGEAHANPLIDHCHTCAPRWGVVPVYAEIDVAAEVARGYAVRLCDTPADFVASSTDPYELVSLTEKSSSGSTNYMAYVANDVRAAVVNVACLAIRTRAEGEGHARVHRSDVTRQQLIFAAMSLAVQGVRDRVMDGPLCYDVLASALDCVLREDVEACR
jgi:hypothetical protein